MFQGQSNLKDKGQGHQVSNSLYVIKTRFKFEGKILNDSKVIMFTRDYTDDNDYRTITQYVFHPVGGGERGKT